MPDLIANSEDAEVKGVSRAASPEHLGVPQQGCGCRCGPQRPRSHSTRTIRQGSAAGESLLAEEGGGGVLRSEHAFDQAAFEDELDSAATSLGCVSNLSESFSSVSSAPRRPGSAHPVLAH